MAFPTSPSHYVSLLVIWLLLISSITFAVEIENRPLVPNSTTRSPAEAGLESGRYQEIPIEKLEDWERKQDQNAKKSEDSKVESNFSNPWSGR